MIQLGFHGAAGTVTGSKYLLTVNDQRILIDCGMFQGPRELRERNWIAPPFDAESIDAVILTHAHIDHIGYLPRLIRLGYSGPVYATLPTCELCEVSLLDSAQIQEEDAEYRNRKKLSRHKVVLPLYTEDDAKEAIGLLKSVPFDVWTEIGKNIRFRMHIAGHLLGAAGVEVEANDGERKISLLFSGDVGRYGNPLTVEPAPPPATDYVICESTYGGRIHPPSDAYFDFEQLMNEIIEQRSILLIPAFSIGRTQQVAYVINRLIKEKRIPPVTIHIDSPMAITASDLYCKYSSYHAVDISELSGNGCMFGGKNIKLHRKRKASKMLNDLKGPAVIMSASGMLTGGRILHHLINRLPDPTTTLALVGYMAEGTLGRRLQEGERQIRIHKQPVEVRARIVSFQGLSGHADYYEIEHWLEPIKNSPRGVFVTHGEPSQSEAMANHLKEKFDWECRIPRLDETVTLT